MKSFSVVFFKGKLHYVEPEIFHENMALELAFFCMSIKYALNLVSHIPQKYSDHCGSKWSLYLGPVICWIFNQNRIAQWDSPKATTALVINTPTLDWEHKFYFWVRLMKSLTSQLIVLATGLLIILG